MSMKRNILKKSLSEDLTWADFLKNDNHYNAFTNQGAQVNFLGPHARSLYSTPERKAEKEEEEETSSLLIEETKRSVDKEEGRKYGGKGKIRSGTRGKKGKSHGKHHHSTQNSFNSGVI
jgi:hypothetical protein